MLAAAMTIAMLIATAFGIHHEAQRVRLDDRDNRFRTALTGHEASQEDKAESRSIAPVLCS